MEEVLLCLVILNTILILTCAYQYGKIYEKNQIIKKQSSSLQQAEREVNILVDMNCELEKRLMVAESTDSLIQSLSKRVNSRGIN